MRIIKRFLQAVDLGVVILVIRALVNGQPSDAAGQTLIWTLVGGILFALFVEVVL